MGLLDSAIQNQPEYAQFRQAYAERKAPLVIICGSGLSAPANLPTWPQLRTILEREAEKKVNSLNKLGDQMFAPRLETAKRTKDYWIAFKLLKEILSPTVFNRIIEDSLRPKDETIPPSYGELLRLNPRGFVTLNLDGFAGEALSEASSSRLITPIYGKELAGKWNALQAAKIFLVYLHGGIHDPDTWVLTNDDLSVLLNSEGHNYFLKNIFLEHLVLFVGVSADDAALSQRLLQLRQGGFNPRNLYWLTTRMDSNAEVWASRSSVSMIRYVVRNEADHQEIIRNLVDDCLSYIAVDRPEPPLIQETSFDSPADHSTITDPNTLATQHPEFIRKAISRLLNERLQSSSEDDIYAVYRDFCEEYEYPVHHAFFHTKKEGFRKWFDYELEFPPLGKGNFGEVFSARAPSGELVAVKIMHESIFGNDEMLGGFRRGVRSMGIVSKYEIPGMLPIITNFELPPTIVMPYVAGLSLEDALSARPDLDWIIKLAIARKIARIVADGHALPQTVLHRDIKPSNIMIENMDYSGVFDPEVVVLDFDMSWHKGSRERDIVFESRDDFGYLAPEQTDGANKYTAKSTRVDSYGLGMTMFFIFGLEAPRPNEALSNLWFSRALRATQRNYQGNWKSAPYRLARLITRATAMDQNRRIDFATILRELIYLEDATSNRSRLSNPELWSEELLSRMTPTAEYDWDDVLGEGSVSTPTGLSIRSGCNIRQGSVWCEISYMDHGSTDRSRLGKYLNAAVAGIEGIMRAAGWSVPTRRVGSGEALIRGECEILALEKCFDQMMGAATSAVRSFRVN